MNQLDTARCIAKEFMNAPHKIIYVDTEIGTRGAVIGVNGEVDNPVNNYEDAKKIAEYFEKHGISTTEQEI
jgi:hypothetical protein